jgi:hypothetical protein
MPRDMSDPDRHPDIWPRVDLEPMGSAKALESLIKKLTDGEPMEVRELSGDFIEADFRVSVSGRHVGAVGWCVFDGEKFIECPSDIAVRFDRVAVGIDPAASLSADSDSLPECASGNGVHVEHEGGAARDGLQKHVQAVAIMTEGEGANVEDVEEAGGCRTSRAHLHHVATPQGKIGLRIGLHRFLHFLSLKGFRRARLARLTNDTPKSSEEDAA